jgi:hypothetical protein
MIYTVPLSLLVLMNEPKNPQFLSSPQALELIDVLTVTRIWVSLR